MFKNSKLLKGIVISLAFVLVLGGAFLLKQWVEASEKAVVFYVDDKGDNTTGKDIASAYTTIGAATKAASEMGLEPGTEVRILIGEQLTLTTQSIDVNVAKDKNGDKLPVVVTSMNADDPDNYAVIYQAYRVSDKSGVPTSPSQRARIINTLTLKDIVFKAKVHDVYQANKDDGKQGSLYRVRKLFVDGNDVTFDNVRFTTDLGDLIDGKYIMDIYCDDCTVSDKKDSPTVTFKNGDYTNVYVYGNSAIMPNYDITVNFENCKMSTVYAVSNSDKTDNVNCNSLKVTFKDTTFRSFYPFNGGDYTIPDGVEITFDNSSLEIFRTKDRQNEVLTGDLTWNFKGDTTIIPDNGSIYLTPVKGLTGDLTTNFSGGTFADSIFVAGGTSFVKGNVVNNITGGNFKKFFAGGGRASNISGTITNNISGSPIFAGGKFIGGNGEKASATAAEGKVGNITNNIKGAPTFKAMFFGGSLDGVCGDVTNTVEGPIVFEKNYFGGGGTDTKNDFLKATTGEVKNTVKGALFTASFYGGNSSGTCQNVTNVVSDEVFFNYYYGGGAGSCTSCGDVKNTLDQVTFAKSGATGGNAQKTKNITTDFGDNVVFKDYFYGGVYSGNCGDIINNFKGENITVESMFYSGNRQDACEDIWNHFTGKNIRFLSYFHGGNRGGTCGNVRNQVLGDVVFGDSGDDYYYGGSSAGTCGDVENYLDGIEVNSTYSGGNSSGKVGNIYNEFTGGSHFKSWTYCSSGKATSTKDTINNITHATFEKFIVGGPINNVGQNVVNCLSSDKVIVKQAFYGGGYSATSSVVNVTNYISDGVQFKGTGDNYRVWLAGFKNTVTGTTTNIISDITFNNTAYGGSFAGTCDDIYNEFANVNIKSFAGGSQGGTSKEPAPCTVGDVTNNFVRNVKVSEYFYAGNASNAGSIAGNITNHLNGVNFAKMYVGGSVDGVTGTVINNVIASTTFNGVFYGGGYNATSVTGDIYNYLTAATIKNGYYGGGSNGSSDNIYNYILGSVSFPASYTYYGGNKAGSNGNITNVISAPATFNGNFIAAGATNTNGDITTWAFNGATFKKCYYGGAYGANAKANNVTNNLIGAKFTSTASSEYVWLSGNNGKTNGKTVNNLSGSTFSNLVFGGKRSGGTCADIENNITSCTFTKDFFAGSAGTATVANIVNNVQGNTTFTTVYYGGNEGGTVSGNITNNIYATTVVNSHYFGGSKGGSVGNVTNNLSGLTVKGAYAGAGSATKIGHIVNNADASVSFKNAYYGGPYANNAKAESVQNNLTGLTFSGSDGVWLGGNNGSSEVKGTVTNNLNGVTFNVKVYGGKRSGGTCHDIINNITSCTFNANFYGGSPAGTVGNITNTVKGNSVFTLKYVGGNEKGTAGSVTNELYSIRVTGTYIKGNEAGTVTNGAKENKYSDTDVILP